MDMFTGKCMFFRENESCNKLSKEHIIQKKLGGSLTSERIICKNCNEYFSQTVDNELVELYRPILINLAPIIGGYLKKTFMDLDSSKELLPLKVKAGGVAGLKKGIWVEEDNDGNVIRIVADESYSPEKIKKIAEKKGVPSDSLKITHEPISKLLKEPEYAFETLVTENSFCAVLLNLFELIRYCTIKWDLPDIASSSKLKPYRELIRKRVYNEELKLPILPIAPISDILNSFFEPSVFSHKMVICYEHETDSLILAAQYLDTMPWLFTFQNLGLYGSSISFLYKKALVGGKDCLSFKDKAVLTLKGLHWRFFSAATLNSINFAKTKFLMAIREQYSRSAYVLDMNNDNLISRMLTGHIDEFKQSSKIPEVRAIVEVMKIRYAKSSHKKEISNQVQQKAKELLSNKRHIGGEQVLTTYRSCLDFIAQNKKYGFPKLLEPLDLTP